MLEEEEKERLLEGVTVLDFDMLCSTVALRTAQGKWGKLGSVGVGEEEEEEEGGEFGGVLRMWEGEPLDCFDDHRIALESTWYVIHLQCASFFSWLGYWSWLSPFLFVWWKRNLVVQISLANLKEVEERQIFSLQFILLLIIYFLCYSPIKFAHFFSSK